MKAIVTSIEVDATNPYDVKYGLVLRGVTKEELLKMKHILIRKPEDGKVR